MEIKNLKRLFFLVSNIHLHSLHGMLSELKVSLKLLEIKRLIINNDHNIYINEDKDLK
jgi:hypothetical protein